MARKLKVFRTPIGFHDAYVAVPTQKAALEAWGTDRNLFARGDAEEVTDPRLTKEPLSQPGTVFKKSRGDASAQFAALDARPTGKTKATTKTTKGKPRPSRAALAEAEDALAAASARHEQERRAIEGKIAQLEREHAKLVTKHERERAKLEKAVELRDRSYRAALAKWRP